jgi:hypothetical protein
LLFGLSIVRSLEFRASYNLIKAVAAAGAALAWIRGERTQSMGLFQRLFGATRDAIVLPNFDAGNKAVDISATILRKCIDLGSSGTNGANQRRLFDPFARGYLFGFSDACIQRLAVLDELQSLALITLIHTKIFGHEIGSLLVGDALRDQRNAEFARGRTVGARDLFRWLDERSYTPLALTDYLHADDEASNPKVPSSVSPSTALIEPTRGLPATIASDATDVPARRTPRRWNTALVTKKTMVEAKQDKNAAMIRLRTRLHMKTVKPIKR